MHPNKGGYIDEKGKPLRIKQKIKGTQSVGKKYPTLFDGVTPFVNGCASVYLKKSGWKHILTKKVSALFCSSIYNGECIIVTDDGIKQYQENEIHQALVKRILSSSASLLKVKNSSNPTSAQLIFKEGTLTLDSLMRVVKYGNEVDSIVFIEKNKKVIVKKVISPVDTLSIDEDSNIELTAKNLQANAQGRAYTEVKIKNTSNATVEGISVSIACAGTGREWNGDLWKPILRLVCLLLSLLAFLQQRSNGISPFV